MSNEQHYVDVQTLSWNLEYKQLIVFAKTMDDEEVILSLCDYVLPIYLLLQDLDPKQRMALEFEMKQQQIKTEIVKKIPFRNSVNLSRQAPKPFLEHSFLKIDTTTLQQFYQVRKFFTFENNEQKYFRLGYGKADDCLVLFPKPLQMFNGRISPPITKFFMENPEFKPCMWYRIHGVKLVRGNDRTLFAFVSVLPKGSRRKYIEPLPEKKEQCPLRICSFDFETMGSRPEKDAIFQVGITFETLYSVPESPPIQRVLLNLGPCLPIDNCDVQVFKTEKELLLGFLHILKTYPFDFLTGYNIYGFDLKMLQGRLKFHNILNCMKRLHRMNNIRLGSKDVFKTKKSGKGEGYSLLTYTDILGMTTLDLFPIMKKYDNRLRSHSLNAVSEKYVGEKKVDLSYKEMKELVKVGTAEAYHKIGVYCVQDTHLPNRLLEKLNLLLFQINFANISRFPLNLIFVYGEQLKIYSQIYLAGTKAGFVFKDPKWISKEDADGDEGEGYQGATVLPPVPGLYEGMTALLDFASLYPTTMISNNLCPTTYIKPPLPSEITKKRSLQRMIEEKKVLEVITDDEPAYFLQAFVVKGIIPQILETLLSERYATKKEMKHAKGFEHSLLNSKQLALKICANSIYGIFGTSFGALALIPLSRATTALGRKMIDQTMQYCHNEAQDKYPNIKVIYGDSVSKNSLLTLQLDSSINAPVPSNGVIIKSIEDFWLQIQRDFERSFRKDFLDIDSFGKERMEIHHDFPYRVWSDQGFTKINSIIRHRPRTRKMFRITTKSGIVEVTPDHSLLQKIGNDGEMKVVKPEELKVGDRLVHKKFVF
jgi:DNA polymerase elongation subunit (family B)